MEQQYNNNRESNIQNLNINIIQQPIIEDQIMEKQMNQQLMTQQPILQQPMMLHIIQMGYQIVDPFEILKTSLIVKIKQEIEFFEIIRSCETNNRYDVYAEINNQKFFLFRCKEESTFCMRKCYSGDCRELNIKCILPSKELFAILYRQHNCTCLCCNRPEMICKFASGNKFGRIREPYKCCTPYFKIYDQLNYLKYILKIPCCQCGFLCRNCCCEKCNQVFFNIYQRNNLEKIVGTISKNGKFNGEMISDDNNFIINFPIDANVYDKLNIIATVLLVVYRFYEENINEDDYIKNNGRNRYIKSSYSGKGKRRR